ncbi:putative aldehyde dehydrogenase family protein [Gorgonomyces haynaldii]|nr:putative aldehyde dehydrogenase family protein [Gorgonomyces haynaldii]
MKLGNWIGKLRIESDWIKIINPAIGKEMGQIARANKETVNAAISLGQRTFESGVWSRMDTTDRFRIMTRIATLLQSKIQEFAHLETLQTGRPIREMQTQLSRLPEWIEYFAALQRTHQGNVNPFKGQVLNYVKRYPLGVVSQITPWNHPLLIAIKKIAPAISAGNSVVVKPSELAPINVVKFAELCQEAGLPEGVLNVVCGYGPEIGPTLCGHPLVRKLDITGGTETGRTIASQAGNNLVECIAELGGKAPVIVFQDSNIQDAVNGACFASFIASGQTCVMGSRILVHESVKDEFVDKLRQKVNGLKMGDPLDQETQIGPVITKESKQRIHAFVQRAQEQGGRIVTGGVYEDTDGYFYPPTVIDNVTNQMDIFHKEVFGPVVSVTSFKDDQEAVRLANDSEFGLAASLWTENISRAHLVSEQLRVGIVWVNAHHFNDPSSPWGGEKLSGMGRENGIEAYLAYTTPKSVVINYGQKPDWFGQKNARYG